MAENGNGSKYPTFQMLLGIAVSIIIIIAGASLTETRSDIRDGKKATAEVCDRVTVLETASRLQFEAIRQWRDETRDALNRIATTLDAHERSTKSGVIMKKWQDYPAGR